MKTALIIESDSATCRFVQFLLHREGFRVLTAESLRQALPVVQTESPDLVVLDLVSREARAAALCRELRNWYREPVVALTSSRDEQLVVDVLDAGADAYEMVPFKPAVLLARVRALLRARSTRPQTQDIISSGELEIDLMQRRVFVAGKPVRLTRTELKILAFLARNQNRAVSSEAILEKVWGPYKGATSRACGSTSGTSAARLSLIPPSPGI